MIFPNNKGQNLFGYFYKSPSKTLMITCHGLNSWNHWPQVPAVFTYYHKLGYSTLRFDFTGCGKSEGKRSLNLQQRIEDIGSALQKFGNGNQEIILNVSSLAGILGVIAATRYPQITKLIITNGIFNFKDLNLLIRCQLQAYLLFHPEYKEEIQYVIKNSHPEKINIPTFVIYSQKDKIVPSKQSTNFYQSLTTDKTLKFIPKAGHYPIKKENIQQGNQIVKEWLSKYDLPV